MELTNLAASSGQTGKDNHILWATSANASQRVIPTGDYAFKDRNIWRAFSFKSPHSASWTFVGSFLHSVVVWEAEKSMISANLLILFLEMVSFKFDPLMKS
ncbi:uncharacterized protein LOC143269476 [Peromyscus maniculatus bairdii]|uniref:uncharacterized protein LOC143269476 n=1 Tax=Peromyscus maniculatus bairdii TaxID=230844 RepID=UPI003FD026D3